MDNPVNGFKRGLAEGRSQIGIWCALPGSYAAELVAGAGFDWMVLDTEHAPNDPLTVLPQLQAVAAYGVSPLVRVAANDTVLIKRLLDVGAQSLLVPYVQTPEEAAAAVAAMRYAPEGVRGFALATRATRFGRVRDYARTAAEELCLVVQVETAAALERLEAIAGVDGVDAVFIGPADLAASMGHAGELGHPEVVAAVEDGIARLVKLGRPAGVLAMNPDFARRCIALGASFTAVGIDSAILARGADALAAAFR